MSSLLTTIRKSSLGWLIVPLVVLAAATGLALAWLPLLWAALQSVLLARRPVLLLSEEPLPRWV